MIGTALLLMMAQPMASQPAAPPLPPTAQAVPPLPPAAQAAPPPPPASAPRRRGRPPAAVGPQPPMESGADNPLPVTPASGPRPRRAPRAVDPDRAAVMTPINAMLRALETNDGAAILASTLAGGGATMALEGETGQRRVRRLTWAEFAGGLRGEGNRSSHRLTAPRVMIDGDIAMVWARYTVRRGRQVQHCGTDHFDLVRDAGQWKIVNLTWSRRTTACAPARAPRTAAAPAAE